MKLAIILGATVLVCAIQAEEMHSAVDAVPRSDRGWKDRQELLNKRATEAGEKAQVIFIGDSITQGWKARGKRSGPPGLPVTVR